MDMQWWRLLGCVVGVSVSGSLAALEVGGDGKYLFH